MKKIFLIALAGILALGAATSCNDSEVEFTVTFNTQGGSAVTPQVIPDGGKITKPADPTRADYTFAGWYKETACINVWDFDKDVVRNALTLYAKWTGAGAPGDSQAKIDLKASIDASATLKQGDYTSTSWAAFQTALTAAATAYADTNSTDAQLTAAKTALDGAKNALVAAADKSSLSAAVTATGTLRPYGYTAESWTAFQTARNAAIGIQANGDATQAQVDEALTNLNTAVEGLQAATSSDNGGSTDDPAPDKTSLSASITAAQGKTEGDYTSDSWASMQSALTAAIAIQGDTTASQAQVDAAKANLDRSVAALQHTAAANETTTKTDLDTFIADTDKLVEADYTADSWAVLQSALTDARQVSADGSATQSQINSAYAALETAVQNLMPSTANTGTVSTLTNQLISLVNALPTVDQLNRNPLLAVTTRLAARTADGVRDALMLLLGNTAPDNVLTLNETLNGVLSVVGLGDLI